MNGCGSHLWCIAIASGCWAATGAGKTVVFAELIRHIVEAGGRALVLVHRAELIEQAKDTLHWIAPELRVGVVKAEQDEHDAPVVIASVQTAWRPSRLARLGNDFQLVVVDEAHHAPAGTWRTIINALNGVPVLGVTATPFRGDGTPLAEVFDQVVYQKSITDMIPEWLCDLRGERIKVRADFNRLHTVGGEINQGEAGEMLMNANAPAEIVAAYKRYALGRKSLCFTPTIAVAEAVAKKFREAGVAAEALSDQSAPDERKAILSRLRSGKTLVVPNCTILTEGFDAPDVSCIIIARPTKSKTLYTQMIGRGTRKAAGKSDCLVLDTTGATERHDLHNLGSIFGIATLKPGESVLEAKVREQVEREQAHLDALERGNLVSTRVEMMREAQLHWAVAPDGGMFVLSLGAAGSLRIVQTGAGWLLLRKYGAGERWREVVLGTYQELTDATDEAERMAGAEEKAGAIVDKAAPWRARPVVAGSPQTQTAAKAKIAYTPGKTTKGELADQLTLHFARVSEAFRTGQRRRWA